MTRDIICSERQWSAMRPAVIQTANLQEGRGVRNLFKVDSECGHWVYFYRA